MPSTSCGFAFKAIGCDARGAFGAATAAALTFHGTTPLGGGSILAAFKSGVLAGGNSVVAWPAPARAALTAAAISSRGKGCNVNERCRKSPATLAT